MENNGYTISVIRKAMVSWKWKQTKTRYIFWYHQQLYKSTSKVKVNDYKFKRLLPPPKGSGFSPTTTERILFMNLKDFYYDLPQELIAQDPLEDRSASRLLVLDKKTGEINHQTFRDI